MIHKRLSTTVKKIVHVLCDGQFHSGLRMGQDLGMSRTAIWKAMGQLQEYGVAIESQKQKGYRLNETLVLLDHDIIFEKLNDSVRNNIDFQLFSSLPSTNDFPGIENHAAKIKVCVSEQQTQGRGRMGRVWQSPFGRNVYLSVQFQFDMDVSEMGGFSLAVATTLVKAFSAIGIEGVQVKWPNDILYEGKKVAGVLIEVKAESNGVTLVNIGMGINVNTPELNESAINQPWTSLSEIKGQYIDRNTLVAELLNGLYQDANIFTVKGLSAFQDDWSAHDFLKDKTITVTQAGNEYTGVANGIDQAGHLLLNINGTLKSFSSGDTSVVKKSP